MENVVEANGPLLLGANNHRDLWSLCPNSTANGRVDIVYAAKSNHAHYLKSSCREVYLEQV
ncbi:hypothetical protein BDZ94DRAFT_1272633 [Collybia nuda]|uniref:Uncharacterized protein n=1 Tax=Collybia nuda TaxID=64659 RepID=A0A9P6CD21_9AGAR|nr:hypothetical protein BDZ94DRAFT_1272633 [Collybia nuda]